MASRHVDAVFTLRPNICCDAGAEYDCPPIGVNMGGFYELWLNVGGIVGRPLYTCLPHSTTWAFTVAKQILSLFPDPWPFSQLLAPYSHRCMPFLIVFTTDNDTLHIFLTHFYLFSFVFRVHSDHCNRLCHVLFIQNCVIYAFITLVSTAILSSAIRREMFYAHPRLLYSLI